MATKKVTVTLDEQQVEAIRSLVKSGRARSVSGFVQDAVSVTLDDMVGWGAALALALEATGGEMSASEREWADRVLGVAGPSDRTAV